MDNTQISQTLFALIQFDMNQIQNYREAIFEISVAIIGGSFGISAFIYRRDNTVLPRRKPMIIIGANCLLLIITIAILYSYFDGLKLTRSALEIREDALTDYYFKHKDFRLESLYPRDSTIEKHEPERLTELPLRVFQLEIIPLYLVIVILIVKMLSEGLFLSDLKKQEAPT